MTEILTHQPKVMNLIKKAFASKKMTHAYLFHGDTGVGKKDAALWMAKRFFCLNPVENEPCNECSECKRIDSMNHPDLHIVEPDGQSIKIDQIRSLQKEFHYKGVEGNKKCYIIEQVDKMTVQAANSLLKFLEEPNGISLAILLTENKHRLLDTILSRTQHYQFQPLNQESIMNLLLKEGIDRETAYLLTQIQRPAQELLEDDWIYRAKDLLFETLSRFNQEPYGATVYMQTEWPAVFSDKNKQLVSVDLLITWFRQVLLALLKRPIWIDRKELIFGYLQVYKQEELTDILSELVSAKGKLRSNGHYGMLLDSISKNLVGERV